MTETASATSPKRIDPSTPGLTPLMRQYWEIKNDHTDKVLFFRMGDFYEMFHDDAVTAAPILNIALTARNKKAEDEIPMCGIPHHSVAGPISRLLQAGYKVAICDQLEDPETAKGIVKRGVTRVMSPGMVYDPQTLNELKANFICSYDESSVSFLDATTGEAFFYRLSTATESGLKKRYEIMSLLKPVELLLTGAQKIQLYKEKSIPENGMPLFIGGDAVHLTVFENTVINHDPAIDKEAPASAQRLLAYARGMQGEELQHILRPFEERRLSQVMTLPETVIRHLEIFKTLKGEEKGSLFQAVNRTKTSAGARLLKSWLQFPLVDKALIEKRQGETEKWTKRPTELKTLRQTLQSMGDIERRLSKISYTNCNVHDLVALMQSLETGLSLSQFCPELRRETIKVIEHVQSAIAGTLNEDPPVQIKNGGVIRKDFSPELNELVTLAEESQRLLLELETREREKTAISSLKVRYNNVFGYFIEVTNSHTNKVPDHYKRKQTLANAERYITQELHELESKILSARTKRVELEEKIFHELRRMVLQNANGIRQAAYCWSELDVYSSLAWLAIEHNYVRPEINTIGEVALTASRHPVIEQEVRASFVANNIVIRKGDCLLLTGPNMAGKSTLMRQVACIALLAQVGSFVPAKRAVMPVFDRLFTRIGASDSLSEGLSTFMVEMKETSEMLLDANENSLVILDEVGRGTSTYDGMSLAQAILENLVQVKKPIVFFATHYHEITALSEQLPTVRNGHMAISEKDGDIKFLYLLRQGPANKSYGIHVAKLAGIPKTVISRAEKLLSDHIAINADVPGQISPQLDLLAFRETNATEMAAPDPETAQLLLDLKAAPISTMTPLEALNKISEWQQRLS